MNSTFLYARASLSIDTVVEMMGHEQSNLTRELRNLICSVSDFFVFCLFSSIHRENLFRRHSHITQLAPTLLHVFVSIEMTGQGVEFEQKFNYRRPMYAILEYLWEKEIHKNVIKVRKTPAFCLFNENRNQYFYCVK